MLNLPLLWLCIEGIVCPGHLPCFNAMCMLSHFSRAPLSVTPWTVACHILLSVGFSRQEYLSVLWCPPPGDLPNPGIKSGSPTLQPDSLPSNLYLMINFYFLIKIRNHLIFISPSISICLFFLHNTEYELCVETCPFQSLDQAFLVLLAGECNLLLLSNCLFCETYVPGTFCGITPWRFLSWRNS